MEKAYFQYFVKMTAGFFFSAESASPVDISAEEHHRHRVEKLMTQVRKMAIKKSFQMPGSFSREFDQNDWVQLALVTLFECCESYDRRRPFEHYVRFMVSRRLVDQQRRLFRKNPPADRDLYKLYDTLKKSESTDQAIKKLADNTGRSETELRRILLTGPGERVFTEQTDDILKTSTNMAEVSPESEMIQKEARRILWECINLLSKTSKMLFLRHEMDKWSFRKIFELNPNWDKSFATFKRWYNSEIFDRVKSCVTVQYA